jgi:hypothetical protein
VPSHSSVRSAIGAALLALACAASAGTAPPSDDDLPLRCEGAACAKVATPVPWPDLGLEDGTAPFNLRGAFSFRLPAGARQYLLLDNGIMAVYPERRWISVQVLTATAMGLPSRDGEGSSRAGALSLSDMPRILYTKTPADPEPSDAEDLNLWRLALVFKNSHFRNATQVQVAQRGPLTAYFADWGAADSTGDIQVVHSAVKDAHLFVQFKGFAFDDVRRMVGSIETRRKP